MRKYYSYFAKDIAENSTVMWIFLGIFSAYEMFNYLLFGILLRSDSFGEAVYLGNNVVSLIIKLVCVLIIGIVIIAIVNASKANATGANKTITHTDLFIKRLLISERAAVLIKVMASSLRLVFVICFQIVLVKIMHVIYLKYGNCDYDQLASFMDIYATRQLSFLFPGNSVGQWVYMGALVLASGALGAAMASKFPHWRDFVYIIIFIISGYNIGIEKGTGLFRTVFLGVLALIVIVRLMNTAHSGKKPARNE